MGNLVIILKDDASDEIFDAFTIKGDIDPESRWDFYIQNNKIIPIEL